MDKPLGSYDSKGYLAVKFMQKLYRAHRLAWAIHTGEWPKNQIDHANAKRDDNSWENLREATNTQNCQNAARQSNNRSGYKGVTKHFYGRWQARITYGGKHRHIGLYDTAEEAHAAYVAVAKREFGKFARA